MAAIIGTATKPLITALQGKGNLPPEQPGACAEIEAPCLLLLRWFGRFPVNCWTKATLLT